MRKITGYIGRTLFNAMALTLLVFLSLDFIFGLIGQLEKANDVYTIKEAIFFMLLKMPQSFYVMTPFACLIGALAGLGILAGSSELVIIRAAGVSIKRIAWMALRPAFLFILMALFVGEYVAPYTEQTADNRRTLLLYNWVRGGPKNMWNREGNEFMHVNAVLPSGVVYGLTRYSFDDNHKLKEASYTKQAIYQQGYWQEEDVSITHINADAIAQETLASRRWNTDLTPNLFNILVLDPENLSMRNLRYYTHYLKEQNLNAGNYSLAFWQKCLQPLATASLVLIAISFIFGPLRSVTMGQRIFTGIILGVVFLLLQKLLGPSSLVFGFPPFIAVLTPIMLCVLIGVFLLRRAQ